MVKKTLKILNYKSNTNFFHLDNVVEVDELRFFVGKQSIFFTYYIGNRARKNCYLFYKKYLMSKENSIVIVII